MLAFAAVGTPVDLSGLEDGPSNVVFVIFSSGTSMHGNYNSGRVYWRQASGHTLHRWRRCPDAEEIPPPDEREADDLRNAEDFRVAEACERPADTGEQSAERDHAVAPSAVMAPCDLAALARRIWRRRR